MTWRRLDGYTTERGVIGPVETDLLAHYEWEGEPCSMYFFCIRCAGDEVRFDHAAYEGLFPLEVGKSVEFRRSIGQWEWINRIETLDENMQRFAATFGRTFTPRERKLVVKKPRQPEDHYTPALQRRVEQAYAREMKLFGYDGFDLCQPIVPLTPLSRRSLHYDYVSDVLAVDGVELTREAASVE